MLRRMVMHYTKEYIEKRLKELEELKAYINNPCMVCGPDNWSTYMCDPCNDSFYDEILDMEQF
jgi:hypothetical protein